MIGLDFDNTIIDYDRVFRSAAAELGLVVDGDGLTKKEIRDSIRQSPDGEQQWMTLQSVVYSSRIREARVMPGVFDFLRECRERHIPTSIVSHKTIHAHFDAEKKNLRELALNWLLDKGIVGDSAPGPEIENVFFESTREEKIFRIGTLRCRFFIDDLEEIFIDPDFPPDVGKIQFSSLAVSNEERKWPVFADWASIQRYVFQHY